MAKTFSDSAVLSLGWKRFKENVGFWIGVQLIAGLIILIPLILSGAVAEASEVLSWLFYAIYIVAAIIVGMGFVYISIKMAEKKKTEIKDLFAPIKRFFPYLAVSILYGVIVYVGFFLFIIPGLIWATMFALAPWYVIDKGMGPIEALKKSAAQTKGARWDILAFYLPTMLISVLGVLALGIGLFVAAPVVMVAQAGVYKALR